MICKKIVYKNFRNIEYAELSPSENVTVLNGLNGQGKTNFLEGVYLFAGVRSFRTAKENELVRFGEDFAELNMLFNNGKRDINMTLRWVSESGKRFCRINGVPITKLSEMVGNFRAVLFCPGHLSVVKDGPAMRRRFLDSAISQIDSSYLRSLQKYNSVLAQRNALIKMSRERRDDSLFLSTAEMWSEQLAREAEIIAFKRNEYTEKLNGIVKEIISDMTAGKEFTDISYQTPKRYDEYIKLLTENTVRELKAGVTLYGIHKDDLKIELCGKDARAFASQGQQRSVALAMKIGEGELSREFGGEYPVFLFDDILSELDDKRRKYLLDGVKGRQVIITSCDGIETESLVYKVCDGKLSI
ncbi:MAG: DNA replication/repair protein RecF [Clostridia bacterium]|nr:DNA replication/repair protein RecF [Clostridia bacterium]